MKTLKKAISLTMSVVMLITAAPVLQAAEFSTTLDMAELNALREEISSSMPADGWLKAKKKTYEGLPDAQTIEARYKQAVENNKRNLERFKLNNSSQEYESYVEFLKEEAMKRVKEDPKYFGEKSEEEMLRDAFYTVLYDEMEKAKDIEKQYEDYKDGYYTLAATTTIVAGAIAFAVSLYSSLESIAGWVGLGTVAVVAGAFCLFTSPARPYFPSNLTPDERKNQFLENPFYTLAMFNKSGASDLEGFYNGSEDCAKVLNDAVDIEYYISMNPAIDNMQERLYTQTAYWQKLDSEQKTEYLHNLAERLRAEAKAN